MKLTHHKFALGIASGMSQNDAYQAAYPNGDKSGAAASRLMKHPAVQQEIAKLRQDVVKRASDEAFAEHKAEIKLQLLTVDLKRNLLYKMAMGETEIVEIDAKGNKRVRYPDETARLNAVKLDNEMTGEGWRPPEPDGGGNTFVQNNVTRVTVFKTHKTTVKQTFNTPQQ